MVLALSSVAASLGLVFVFFVVFPALVTGLIAFALAQVFGERAENQSYVARFRAAPGLRGAARNPVLRRRAARAPPVGRPAAFPVARPVAVVTGAARGI